MNKIKFDDNINWRAKTVLILMKPALMWMDLCAHLMRCSIKASVRVEPFNYGDKMQREEMQELVDKFANGVGEIRT